MAIKFETYLQLAEAARHDKELHKNHLDTSSVVQSLNKRLLENTDLLNRIAGTEDDDGLIASLEGENERIKYALTAYA